MKGFAVFFAIFDMSRRAAARARSMAERVSNTLSMQETPSVKVYAPRVVHSTTIVTGGMLAGLSYELVCRPFDVARRCIHISTIEGHRHSIRQVLANKVREDGLLSFFRDPMASLSASNNTWLRMLGRVGPWGVAFLAWENLGPGAP
jgi:hypothetical protein